MKTQTSAAPTTHLDILRQLKDQRKALIDDINAKYDQMIALAESLPIPVATRTAGRSATLVSETAIVDTPPALAPAPVSKKAAKSVEIPLEGTNAEIVIAALEKNGGSATIPEIVGMLSPKHSLMKRKSPSRAISGVLGELRNEAIVTKGKDLRFALVK